MNATTVAVDLAKNVFELALADAHWKIIERGRLTRAEFERWLDNGTQLRTNRARVPQQHH
jgi:transposase